MITFSGAVDKGCVDIGMGNRKGSLSPANKGPRSIVSSYSGPKTNIVHIRAVRKPN